MLLSHHVITRFQKRSKNSEGCTPPEIGRFHHMQPRFTMHLHLQSTIHRRVLVELLFPAVNYPPLCTRMCNRVQLYIVGDQPLHDTRIHQCRLGTLLTHELHHRSTPCLPYLSILCDAMSFPSSTQESQINGKSYSTMVCSRVEFHQQRQEHPCVEF